MRRQIPRGPEDLVCPLHKKPMEAVCHRCPLWVQLRGTNPQTGQEVDEWQCAFTANVLMTIEVANQARQGGAATESFRNEFVALAERGRRPNNMIEGH